VEQAARDLDLDLSRSWMIGDKAADVELARNAGLKSALVLTGYGAGAARDAGLTADLLVPGVLDAVSGILAGA
jgi:D-glycero-D-manno-heptose 1,7-bisphosphate phosphatase